MLIKGEILENKLRKVRILNAFEIKMILIILMTANHLGTISNLYSKDIDFVITLLSRCVAPMFAYFAAEGIRRTASLKKYCIRLNLLALFVQVGNTAVQLLAINILNYSEPIRIGNSIIGIALAVDAIYLFSKSSHRIIWRSVALLLIVVGFLFGEEGTVIVPIILVEYFCCSRLFIKAIWYVLIEIVAVLLPFGEPYYFIFLPLIALYNGNEGRKTRFFYAYYPIHMWLISLIMLITAE